MKPIIVIGLPMFQDISPENKVDAMRFAFVLGRHYPEWDFMISWRTKSEQFRARTYIVNKAREVDAKYLFFMDDDHIVDWQGDRGNQPYLFLGKLLEYMEQDAGLGIVGALYYHRGGGMYKPVLMHDGEDGIATFYDDHEVTGGLQEVDIQGGGIMLIRMCMFDKMKEPYFKPETLEGVDSRGTDLQICRKARELGWKVACDTSIVIGHESSNRLIVSPNNRHLLIEDTHRRGVEQVELELQKWQAVVMKDVCEYLGVFKEVVKDRGDYDYYQKQHTARFSDYDDPAEYYRSIGGDQICRQVMYHRTRNRAIADASIVNMLRNPRRLSGLDYGCGIGVVGFEALRMENYVDFFDIDGTAAFDFLKWRIQKARLDNWAAFTLKGPYDFVLMNDVIEHISDWEPVLDNILGRIKAGGALITNFFTCKMSLTDPEHVHQDRDGVSEFLQSRKFMPSHLGLWIKRDNFLGGAKNVRNYRTHNDTGKD